MSEDQPDTQREDDEFEVTSLRPRRRSSSGQSSLPHLSTARTRQRLLLVLSLLLLIVVVLTSFSSGSGAVSGLSRSIAAPTATQMVEATVAILPQLAAIVAPNSAAVQAVGPAPARCSQDSPGLTADSNLSMGMAIGTAPVLVGGFVGPPATLPVGPAASARLNFPGWTQPYTRYGWPALIDLILHTGISGPVALTGRDLHTGFPLWFGFVMPGVAGAPQQVTRALQLDPVRPAIPAGGESGVESFWFGYAFFPGAGCYTLTASWPGGSWLLTISAGALPSGS